MPLCSFSELTNRLFEIPLNQRGFAWKSEHFEDLIRDMKIAANLPAQNQHYVGPVVVENTGRQIRDDQMRDLNIVTLEDGQQRVTTLMIMSKFLSDRLMAEFNPGTNEYDTGRDLKRCYKIQVHAGGQEPLLKNTNPQFHLMIRHVLLNEIAPGLDSTPLIRLDDMKTTVRDWSNGLDANDLQEWGRQILNSLQFTLIDLSNNINKFLAFDAINSRGVNLTQFDKVKNFCCLVYNIRAIGGGTQPEAMWIRALKQLQLAKVATRSHEETYICDLFNLHHKKSKKPEEVHESLVTEYNDLLYGPKPALQAKLVQFVDNWETYAKSYGFVCTKARTQFYPGAPVAANIRCNNDAKVEMDRIDNLNYNDVSRILLTACHLRFTFNDFAKSASIIEKFVFRVYGVLKQRVDTHKTYLIKSAASIYYGRNYNYLESIICWLLNRPTGGAPMSSVIARLANGDAKYTWVSEGWDRCFYFLYEYETRLNRQRATYAWRKDNDQHDGQKESMEHILPKTRDRGYWDAQWPDDLEFERYRHRLGNLVLTRDRASNACLAQKSIDDKIDQPAAIYDYRRGTSSEKEIYRHADAIGGIRQWRPENIIHREIELLKWAANRWKINCCDDSAIITLPQLFQENGNDVQIDPGFGNRNCINNEMPDWPVDPEDEEE